MKVIFLDIDGVLNCEQTYIDRKEKMQQEKKYILDIDEEKVQLLGKICEATEAKVVLTSSWRFDWKNGTDSLVLLQSRLLQRLFDKYHIEVVGVTPVVSREDGLYHSWRENEIRAYLLEHPEIESFCILDSEMFDLKTLKKFVVKTSYRKTRNNMGGLLESHVEDAIKILSKKK